MKKIFASTLALAVLLGSTAGFAWDPNEVDDLHAKSQEALTAFKEKDSGIQRFVDAAAGYVVINVVIANFIEPQMTGKSVGLSTLVVFVSLIFWGWALGSVGMVLSVPLTMTIKIALEEHPSTRWVAVLLGPAKPA